MELEGGCYCGALRYKTEGEPMMRGQCHCRECQYASGGSPNVILAMPESGFAYTSGTPAAFTRSDLESPVTREFCGTCGSPILSRAPSLPGAVILKVGSLDDPKAFGMPQVAIFTCDQQPFHVVPEGVMSFDKVPG